MTWLDNGGSWGQCGRSVIYPLVAVLGIILVTLFFPGMGYLFMIPIWAATVVLRVAVRKGNNMSNAPVCRARPSPIEKNGLSFSRWAADIECAPFRASFRSLWLGDMIGDID